MKRLGLFRRGSDSHCSCPQLHSGITVLCVSNDSICKGLCMYSTIYLPLDHSWDTGQFGRCSEIDMNLCKKVNILMAFAHTQQE